MPSILTLAKEIHENTIEKGFAKKDIKRSIEEHIALQHSEISEILEEHRAFGHTNLVVLDTGKPVGVPSEFADVAIRMIDFFFEHDLLDDFLFVLNGTNVENQISLTVEQIQTMLSLTNIAFDYSIPAIVNMLHHDLSNAWQARLKDGYIYHYAAAFTTLCLGAAQLGFSLEEIIQRKMAYNKMREYKHGKTY